MAHQLAMIRFTLGDVPFPTYHNFGTNVEFVGHDAYRNAITTKMAKCGGIVMEVAGKSLVTNFVIEMSEEDYLMFRLKYD